MIHNGRVLLQSGFPILSTLVVEAFMIMSGSDRTLHTRSDSDLIFQRTLLGCYAEGMHANFKKNLNTANDGASAKASPFHALIVLGKTTVHTG